MCTSRHVGTQACARPGVWAPRCVHVQVCARPGVWAPWHVHVQVCARPGVWTPRHVDTPAFACPGVWPPRHVRVQACGHVCVQQGSWTLCRRALLLPSKQRRWLCPRPACCPAAQGCLCLTFGEALGTREEHPLLDPPPSRRSHPPAPCLPLDASSVPASSGLGSGGWDGGCWRCGCRDSMGIGASAQVCWAPGLALSPVEVAPPPGHPGPSAPGSREVGAGLPAGPGPGHLPRCVLLCLPPRPSSGQPRGRSLAKPTLSPAQ